MIFWTTLKKLIDPCGEKVRSCLSVTSSPRKVFGTSNSQGIHSRGEVQDTRISFNLDLIEPG